MSGAEAALRAARLGDEVVHGFGLLGMVAGALIGAAVAAVIVAAGVATGGLALVAIVGGCIAGGGLAGGALARGIMKAADIPGPTTGMLAAAPLPSRVTVNGRMALRAGIDFAPACSGAPMNHFPMSAPVLIAEGAQKVTINGMPMARQSMKLVCGAKIKGGSDNVTVGGPTACVVPIHDNEAMFETGLQVLGFVALGAAGIGAVAAGWMATGVFATVVGGSTLGMNALHEWGESLGPGYGDIMVGVAGFALMGFGAKLAKSGKAQAAVGSSDDSAEIAGALKLADDAIVDRTADVIGVLNKRPYIFNVDEALSLKKTDPEIDALLTDGEYLSLRAYTSSLYNEINPALRQGVPGEWHVIAEQGGSGIGKLSGNGYGYSGPVRRDANFTPSELEALFPEGGVFTDRSFMSTSTRMDGVFPHKNTQIYIHNSTKGARVERLSEIPTEAEILYSPGSSFRVASRTYDPVSGKHVVILEEM